MLRALMRRLRHGSDGQDEFVGDVTGCEDLTTTAGPVDAVDAAAATATAVASTVMSVECSIILQALEHQKVVVAVQGCVLVLLQVLAAYSSASTQCVACRRC
jgi:hypothetical protein